MCFVFFFFIHQIFVTFAFSTLWMPLSRVVVPGRLQCVFVCMCALLLQGADSREVCLNREGAQRPCSSCRVRSWLSLSLTAFHPHAHSLPSLCSILLCICVFILCHVCECSSAMTAHGTLQISCLLAVRTAL